MELKIKGVTYRPSVPVTVEKTLDESLDAAHLVIPYTTRKTAFVPFSAAYLNGEKWLIGADVVTEVKGIGKYRHDVTLIEETKRLETLFISAKTVTRHEYRDYTSDVSVQHEVVSMHDPSGAGFYPEDITPADIGVSAVTPSPFSIYSSEKVRNRGPYTEEEASAILANVSKYSSKPYAVWIADGEEVIASTMSLTDPLILTSDAASGHLGKSLEAHYFMTQKADAAGDPLVFFEIKYTITPLLTSEDLKDKTVTDCVKELIEDAEQLRYGDTPRITLNKPQAAKLSRILCPEDSFSGGMSLFEALLQVGDWEGVGGIPKLRDDVLYFEKWGGTEIVKVNGRMIADTESSTSNDYCSAIESNATNMVNDSDNVTNTVADPFYGGYQSVRTEEGGIFIEDNNAIIRTAFPVWKPIKLTMGFVGGKIKQDGGDITPYLYEKSEYDLLSDFESAEYPNSKAYALYYTQGSTDIRGLTFTPRSLSADLSEYDHNTIDSILRVKFGKKPGLSSADIVNLMFRFEYIPYIETRVRQHKMQTNRVEAAMSYSQSGSVISAKTYGDHLRSHIQMLGTTERKVTYIINNARDLPKPGQKYDNSDYIGIVATEHYPNYRRCTLTLSTHYNRINRFVNVKKDLRQFEIPMDKSTGRNICINDYVVLGEYEGRRQPLATHALEEATVKRILGMDTDAMVNTLIATTSNRADKTDGVQVILPVAAMPLGNSVLFFAKYKDNRSAGVISSYNANIGTARRLMRDVRYTDVYGGAKYIHLDYVAGASIPSGADGVSVAHQVPMVQGVTTGTPMMTTAQKPVILNKDAREHISVTYQIHYVTNTDMIIGSSMASTAPYIDGETGSAAMVYLYRTPINPLTGEAAEADTDGHMLSYGEYGGTYYIEMPEASGYSSWAVKKDGKFLFGGNTAFPRRIYLNFRGKLIEEGDDDTPDVVEQVFVKHHITGATHINLADHLNRGSTFHDMIQPYDGHRLPGSITVSIGGIVLNTSQYQWSPRTGVLTVPNVTDTLEITIITTVDAYSVTSVLGKHIRFSGSDSVEHGAAYICNLIPDESYIIMEPSIYVKVGTEVRTAGTGYIWDAEDHQLRIPDATGDIVIRASAETSSTKITIEPFTSRFDGHLRIYYDGTNHEDLSSGLVLSVKTGESITVEWSCPAATLTMFDSEQDATYILGEDSGREVLQIVIRGNGVISMTETEKPRYTVTVSAESCTYSPDVSYAYRHQRLLMAFSPDEGYSLPRSVSVIMNGAELVPSSGYTWGASTGYLIIPDVTGDLAITVSAEESKPTSYTVKLTYEYWDEWQNSLLFTEEVSGEYAEGYVINVPATVTREYNGESTEFISQETYTEIEVTSDITRTLTYAMKPAVATMYNVDIDIEYWDEWGNDLLFTEDIAGEYEEGAVITIPDIVTREYNGEMTDFSRGETDGEIVVSSDIRASFTYYMIQR